MIFIRSKSYDREKCLTAARKAEARGRIRKAIASYMLVLEADPEDHLVHTKLAPLLARKKKFEEAWASFKTAASGYRLAGLSQKAIGVYAHALRFMPRNPEVWE